MKMEAKKLTRFEVTEAIVMEMEQSGNPAVRLAGSRLREMLKQHARGDFNRARDLQIIDSANEALPADYKYQFTYHE